MGLKTERYLLARTRPRAPQPALSRSQHWRSVRGAYATGEGLKVDKLRVLLVDHVMTAGATLDGCARTLKKAGVGAALGVTVFGPQEWFQGPWWPPKQGATSGNQASIDSIKVSTSICL